MDTVISSSGISPSAQPGRSTIESFQFFTESESESESGDSEPELTINNVATQTRFAGVDVCPLPMDDASIQTGEPAWLIHNTTQTTLLRRRGQELEDDAFQSFGHALLHSCNLCSERTGMMLNDPQSSFAEVAPTAPVTGTGTFLTDPTVLEHCLHVRSLLKSVQSAIDADANANGSPMQPVVAQKGIPNKRKKKAASKARKGRTDDDQALEQAFQDNQVVLSGEIAELALSSQCPVNALAVRICGLRQSDQMMASALNVTLQLVVAQCCCARVACAALAKSARSRTSNSAQTHAASLLGIANTAISHLVHAN